MGGYEDYTVNSKNSLARFAHRTRTKVSISLLKNRSYTNLLDFGCGDGNFLRLVHSHKNNSSFIGYEPYMETKQDASKITIYKHWNEVISHCKSNGFFDVITCFEVMEHFSKERQIRYLDDIKKLLKKDGILIISVPIEKGLPSLIKNLRRIQIGFSGNEEIYTFKNIMCSLFGLKSSSLDRLRIGNDYLPHMGFYFNVFEQTLKQLFIIESFFYSPFPKLPYFFNSQAFYILSVAHNS